jgi:hypothetical protein
MVAKSIAKIIFLGLSENQLDTSTQLVTVSVMG